MAKAKQAEAAQALEYLRESVKEGDTIYCVLRSVSASGMSRVIDLKIVKDGRILHLGHNVATACDYRYDRDKQGIRISGCGMDMGFALVYHLAQTMFGDGYKLTSQWL